MQAKNIALFLLLCEQVCVSSPKYYSDQALTYMNSVSIVGDQDPVYFPKGAKYNRFQIGSISKTFTGLLLANAISSGLLNKDKLHRQSLIDLATHGTNTSDGYAYSNLGFKTLGSHLAKVYGTSYLTALTENILRELSLVFTGESSAKCHDYDYAFGCLTSNLADMSHYLKALLTQCEISNSGNDSISEWLKTSNSIEYPIRKVRIADGGIIEHRINLHSEIISTENSKVFCHNGEIMGYKSFIAYSCSAEPKQSWGFVIWSSPEYSQKPISGLAIEGFKRVKQNEWAKRFDLLRKNKNGNLLSICQGPQKD